MESSFVLLSQGLVTSEDLAKLESCTVDTINRNLAEAGVGWLPFKGKNRLWSLPHMRDVIAARRNISHDKFEDEG